MNRSILIVLCDFLLVTLVAFSNFDADPTPPPAVAANAESRPAGAPDLVSTLQLVLEEERQSREQLANNLESTTEALAERERRVQQFEENLRQTEQRARQFEENLRQTEAQTAKIEQERAALAQQAASAQASLTEAQTRLTAATTESLITREQAEALRADLKRREQEARSLQEKLATTEQAVQAAQAEKQQLNSRLQVSETETRLTREQLAELRTTVVAEREAKARIQEYTTVLATNVATLAQASDELTQEIREHRPMAANSIYNQFLTNRITARFAAARSGVLGRNVTRDKLSQGILFTTGAQTYLLLHVNDTPLTLWNPGADWDRLQGVVSRGTVAFSAVRLSFLLEDPRVVVIPVGEAEAQQLGAKIYPVAADPFRFQEAVLVGASEGYYGECKFQLEPALRQYVKLDRSFMQGLFGKFNPSRGDLVLTKTGELLGIMVNSDYCVVLNQVTPGHTLQFGENIGAQNTGRTLSLLFDEVFRLHPRLQ